MQPPPPTKPLIVYSIQLKNEDFTSDNVNYGKNTNIYKITAFSFIEKENKKYIYSLFIFYFLIYRYGFKIKSNGIRKCPKSRKVTFCYCVIRNLNISAQTDTFEDAIRIVKPVNLIFRTEFLSSFMYFRVPSMAQIDLFDFFCIG